MYRGGGGGGGGGESLGFCLEGIPMSEIDY